MSVLTQNQLDRLVDPNDSYYMKRADLVYDLLAKKHSNTKVSNINADIINLRKNVFKTTLVLAVDDTLIYVRHFTNEIRIDDKVKFGDKDAIVTELTYRLDLKFEHVETSTYDHIITTPNERIPERGDWFPDDVTKVSLIEKAEPIGCKIKMINNEWDKEKEEKEKKDEKDEKEKSKEKDVKDKEKETEKEMEKKKKNEDIIEISFLKQSKQLSMIEPVMNRQVLKLMSMENHTNIKI